jgi:DNA topoisomerase-1
MCDTQPVGGMATLLAGAAGASDIRLGKKKIEAVLKDAKKSAEAVDLMYADDRQPGIHRRKKADGFEYYLGRKKVRDSATLERIRTLAIPPAWEKVWICSSAHGHLQATGTDARGRKQYKYHPQWTALRNHTKFYRLLQFGKCIPHIRERLERDLAKRGLPVEKVLAAVVCLMDQTSIRIGNSAYEKLYGSFGLTTLKDQHVKIQGDRMQFMFKGKKGVAQKVSIKNKRLARIVKSCRDIPGKELFQYYDHEGNHKSVDSGMVNAYLKEISGEDFTAKDFRTWSGTVHALTALGAIGVATSKTETKKNVVAALDSVAAHLGNTRTVCKKYYVHPLILTLYEANRLHIYLNCDSEKCPHGVIREEHIVMTILEKEKLC